MKSTVDIIPDNEVEAVHAFANFGDQGKRDVVDEGVLKYALGYDAGSTQLAILREHGLLKASRNVHSYKADLSAKGKEYLRAMFRNSNLGAILALKSK